MCFLKKQVVHYRRLYMKKRAVILPALIALVLIAMFLPWAYLLEEVVNPDLPTFYRPQFGLYAFGAVMGLLYTGLSFVLALAAFVFFLFSGKKLICRIFCGLLLLSSAGLCICEGIIDGFACFTALTWCIFGALIALCVWTLFFFNRNTKRDA